MSIDGRGLVWKAWSAALLLLSQFTGPVAAAGLGRWDALVGCTYPALEALTATGVALAVPVDPLDDDSDLATIDPGSLAAQCGATFARRGDLGGTDSVWAVLGSQNAAGGEAGTLRLFGIAGKRQTAMRQPKAVAVLWPLLDRTIFSSKFGSIK